MVPGFGLYHADPAHLITAGQDLDIYLSDDLSYLSVRRVNTSESHYYYEVVVFASYAFRQRTQ